jgi:hypothetical protein
MRRRRVETSISEMVRELSGAREVMGKIEVALIVREPGSALSAQAYEGLRRTVALSGTHRRQHAAHLIQLLESLEGGATREMLALRIADFLAEIGIEEGPMDGVPDWYVNCDDELSARGPLIQRLEDGGTHVWRAGRRLCTSSADDDGGDQSRVPPVSSPSDAEDDR